MSNLMGPQVHASSRRFGRWRRPLLLDPLDFIGRLRALMPPRFHFPVTHGSESLTRSGSGPPGWHELGCE